MFKPTAEQALRSIQSAARRRLNTALGVMETMKQLESFFDAATAFCIWAESEPAAPVDEVDTAIKLLSKLLSEIHELPKLFDEEVAPELSHEEWLAVYKRFGSLPFNYYASYSEPHNAENPIPGIGDVADDLADIWRDLKSGVLLYRKGNYEAAVWEWRESFRIHWARHAAEALYVFLSWRS